MVEFEYGEKYTERQIFDLIDQSIVCGTTRDIYDSIVHGLLKPFDTKMIVLRYLIQFMDKNGLGNYNILDPTSTKKVSDIIKEHRGKKINGILE